MKHIRSGSDLPNRKSCFNHKITPRHPKHFAKPDNNCCCCFLRAALLTRHPSPRPALERRGSRRSGRGCAGTPCSTLGSPSLGDISPEQLKLGLKTGEVCTTQLLLQQHIPQARDEPHAAPRAATGAAGMSLHWVTGWRGAGGAPSWDTSLVPAGTSGGSGFLSRRGPQLCREPRGRWARQLRAGRRKSCRTAWGGCAAAPSHGDTGRDGSLPCGHTQGPLSAGGASPGRRSAAGRGHGVSTAFRLAAGFFLPCLPHLQPPAPPRASHSS